MKKLRLLAILVLMLMMFAQVSHVAAQSYSFNLTQETVQVYWNNDGTISLDYVFTFTNDPGGHVIDFVDVGMPNGNFDTGKASADANGQSLSISTDFQGDGPNGFSVDMGSQAIQPGQMGSVHVKVDGITGMLHPSTESGKTDTYASGEFSPAYYTTASGSTNMSVIFHLPTGVQTTESIYIPASGGWPCDGNPQADLDAKSRVEYTWSCANASGSTQYTFGMSFPKTYVPADVIVVASAAPSFDIGGIISSLVGNSSGLCCFGIFALFFVALPILNAVNGNKRKLAYLPPKIQIEGHGIKRGLTAVEAGILMEQPLDKVMTMILFGLVKKNAATVITKEPLKIQPVFPLPADMHDYETDFLAAFKDDSQDTRKKGLQEMTVKLVNSVSEKMKGFSRKETVAYYQDIMERAWQQIEAAGTPEVKSQMYDESLEWTMLDKDYDNRTRRVFTGPIFLPMWWGRYDPGFGSAASAGTKSTVSMPGSSGGRSSVSIPGASMAASVVTGVQGFSSHVIGDVKAFTSGVTNRTNPVPIASTKSGGFSGGGGHCACACACAGCACACAGGGR
jgi:hypothetical protein